MPTLRSLTVLGFATLALGWGPLPRAGEPRFPGAGPNYRAWVAAELPGSPEGLTQDAQGRLYASIVKTGEIVRLDGRGGAEHVATIPSPELGRAGMTLGIEFDSRGALYVAYVWTGSRFNNEFDPLHLSCRDSTDLYSGIYQIDVVSGNVRALLTKKDGWPVCFPDDIAIDVDGSLYVTDLTLSGVWKIGPDHAFSLWSADPLLQWPPPPHATAPLGANDLVLDRNHRVLYVVTNGDPAIVRIPINADGSAGAATVVARDLTVLDGVELDEVGNIYVSELLRSEISVFSPDGRERLVIASKDTAPINGPTSLVYRAGQLCVANMGWEVHPEPRTVTCIAGFRRPRPGL